MAISVDICLEKARQAIIDLAKREGMPGIRLYDHVGHLTLEGDISTERLAYLVWTGPTEDVIYYTFGFTVPNDPKEVPYVLRKALDQFITYLKEEL